MEKAAQGKRLKGALRFSKGAKTSRNKDRGGGESRGDVDEIKSRQEQTLRFGSLDKVWGQEKLTSGDNLLGRKKT